MTKVNEDTVRSDLKTPDLSFYTKLLEQDLPPCERIEHVVLDVIKDELGRLAGVFAQYEWNHDPITKRAEKHLKGVREIFNFNTCSEGDFELVITSDLCFSENPNAATQSQREKINQNSIVLAAHGLPPLDQYFHGHAQILTSELSVIINPQQVVVDCRMIIEPLMTGQSFEIDLLEHTARVYYPVRRADADSADEGRPITSRDVAALRDLAVNLLSWVKSFEPALS